MLRTDEASLQDEISDARAWRKQHMALWPDLVSKLGGVGYRDADAKKVEGENFGLSYLSLVLPRVAHDVPRVSVDTDDPEQDIIADELEVALNRWSKRSRLRPTLVSIASDMLLTYGVGMVTQEPDPNARIDLGGAGYSPRVYRVPPTAWIIDPAAEDVDRARYQGHEYPMDYDDLVAAAESDDSYLMDVIEAIAPAEDVSEQRFRADDRRQVPDRREVVMIELWIPEARCEGYREGTHHGCIYTLCESAEGDAKMVRKPRPYYGPPGGPYVLFGAYSVPGDAYPVGPIAAAYGLIEELDRHMKSVNKSANQYRRLLLVDAANQKLAQSIHSSPDRSVVPIENLVRDGFAEVEIGGVNREQIEWSILSRERLERLTGVNEVIRGQVTGDATATEISTANSSSSLRIEWIKRQYLEGCDQLFRRVAWFLVEDRQVDIPLGVEGRERFGDRRRYSGGRIKFGEIDLEIDGYSVERTNDALMQRRAIELLQMSLQLAQAKAAMPQSAQWNKIADAIGEMLNIRDFGAYFRGVAAANAQMPGMGMQPTGPATMGGLTGQMSRAASPGTAAGAAR